MLFRNAYRRRLYSLEIQLAKDTISFDALDKLTGTAANTAHLTLIDGDKQYAHDNYVLRKELALKSVVTTPVTADKPEQTEDRLCVTLCQLSTLEQVQQKQQAQIDALTLAQLGVK